jgi:hypothetical protein
MNSPCVLRISDQVSYLYKTSKAIHIDDSFITKYAECLITNLWSRRCTGPKVKASTTRVQYCTRMSGEESVTTFCSCTTSMLQRPVIAWPWKKILSEYWNIVQIASGKTNCKRTCSGNYMHISKWKTSHNKKLCYWLHMSWNKNSKECMQKFGTETF